MNPNFPSPAGIRILNLAQPSDVRSAETAPGPVYWICPAPPARLLGLLADEVEGAWIENGTAVCQVGATSPVRVPVPHELPEEGRMAFLAELLALCLTGRPPQPGRAGPLPGSPAAVDTLQLAA